MTVAYLDCEFNGYKGDLISLALVIDDDNYFYEVLGCPNPVSWVAENVMPILNKEPIPLHDFKQKLEAFITKYKDLVVVADWPDDIKYLCDALIVAPGVCVNTPNKLSFVLKRVDAPSELPHNALADAKGIKKFIETQK